MPPLQEDIARLVGLLSSLLINRRLWFCSAPPHVNRFRAISSGDCLIYTFRYFIKQCFHISMTPDSRTATPGTVFRSRPRILFPMLKNILEQYTYIAYHLKIFGLWDKTHYLYKRTVGLLQTSRPLSFLPIKKAST